MDALLLGEVALERERCALILKHTLGHIIQLLDGDGRISPEEVLELRDISEHAAQDMLTGMADEAVKADLDASWLDITGDRSWI